MSSIVYVKRGKEIVVVANKASIEIAQSEITEVTAKTLGTGNYNVACTVGQLIDKLVHFNDNDLIVCGGYWDEEGDERNISVLQLDEETLEQKQKRIEQCNAFWKQNQEEWLNKRTMLESLKAKLSPEEIEILKKNKLEFGLL